MAPRLNIIIGSTRPGRLGPAVANWFDGFAREHGAFEPVLVDLADFDLPVYDEPNHPRLRQYVHEHTRRWSASVDAADAYVFVTPEYNYLAPPALVNALDYVLHEWAYKPAGNRQLWRRFRRHAVGADAEAAADQPQGHADPRQRQCRRLPPVHRRGRHFHGRTSC